MFFYKKNLRPFLKYQNAIQSNKIEDDTCFWNQTFDKGRLKIFVLWFLKKYGEHKTIELVEELKNIGFKYATKAGISLGIEDLKIPPKKYSLLMDAELLSLSTIKQYKRGEITGVERFQRLIDTWHRTSERLKQEVIDNFEATDILNPVYMMAFSGARGNISQVRQLVGMRGLMSDPQGQIIDFPIRSNFREGLTLTEYIISSYGARKGIVDTALRTANAGYLTRRLVDVAQHVIISNFDCGTKRGIFLTDMKEGNKTIYSLQNRLIGRVLARDVYNNQKIKIASRNLEVSPDLAATIAFSNKKIFVRSTLTCQTKKLVCQLCYGWSLAQGNLVGIGEAVGVVAAQSIGEPGTQLTMRTFHTGGVFSGDVSDQIRAPFNGIVEYKNPIAGTLIRTPEGKIAFLTKNEGSFLVHRHDFSETKKFKIPFYTLLFLKNGSSTEEKEVIAQISSINRQINATDQAELTIKSEFSGQLYSKILDLKENKVGPKLKNGDKDLEKQSFSSKKKKAFQSATDLEPDSFSKQFYENAIDTVFEAWGWGYAWVLSGKIYQLPFPSTFFPLFGDYVNQKTYMNQIYWNIPPSFGNSFQLMSKANKLNTFGSNLSKNNKEIKLMRQSFQNANLINKKSIILLKNEIISFQLAKIVFKKMGYILKLAEPSFSFSNKSYDVKLASGKSFNFINSKDQTSILSSKDSLFLFSSLSKDSKDKTFNKNSSDKNYSVYPATWKPSFDIFLHWFPKRLSTKTGGLIFIEPVFFGQESNIKNSFKIKKNNMVNHLPTKKLIASNFKTYPVVNNHQNNTLFPYNKIPTKLSNLIPQHNLYKKLKNKLYLSSQWSGELPRSNFKKREKLLFEKMEVNAFSKPNKKLKKNNVDFTNNTFNKKVKFFPTFLQRKTLMAGLPNLKSTQNKLYNVQLEKQNSSDLLNPPQSELLKSFFYFKKNDTSSRKSTSELSKNFIFEQYKQKNFDTFFYTALNVNKNKTKTEIISFGLPWKNAFKLNPNSFVNTINSLLNSKKELKKGDSKKSLNFQRIFWVSQPFYTISLQNSKKVFLNFTNKILKENDQPVPIRNQPILFQSTRQGLITSFLCSEGYIQTNQNQYLQDDQQSGYCEGLSPDLLKNNLIYKPCVAELNLSNKSKMSIKLNSYAYEVNNIILKKHGIYYFSSFNNNVLNDLKKRKTIFSSLLNEFSLIFTLFQTKLGADHYQIKKRIISKENEINKKKLSYLSLKVFSKVSSFPYLLSKNNINLLNKKLTKVLEFSPIEIHKNKSKVSKTFNLKFPDLFSFYFYSIFQKNFKRIKSFNNDFILKQNKTNSKILANKLLNKQFSEICSPYLKDQLSFSILDLVSSSSGVPGPLSLWDRSKSIPNASFYPKGKAVFGKGNDLTIRILENKKVLAVVQSDNINYQFKINYQERCYSFSLNSLFESKVKKEFLNVFLFSIPFKNLGFERITNFKNWFNKAKFYKKMYLKNLLKINKKLYNRQLKNPTPSEARGPNSRLEKPKLLKQKSKMNKGKNKVTKINKITKNQRLNKQNSLLNIMIKPGWVYSTKNVESFFQYQKKIIHPGKKIGNDLLFENNSILIDFIQAKDVNATGFFNLMNPNSILVNQNSFSQTISNQKCRFKPEKAKNFFILFRKANEHKLFKEIEYKKEISKFANKKNQGPCLMNLNQSYKQINFKSSLFPNLNQDIFLNKSFNSNHLLSSFKTGLVNKQKITAQCLSKYPSSNLKIISNSSEWAKLIIKKLPKIYNKPQTILHNYSLKFGIKYNKSSPSPSPSPSPYGTGTGTNQILSLNSVFKKSSYTYLNFNKFSSFGISSSPITLLKPINFLSFMISYKVPFSLDFPFKTSLCIFSESPIHIKQTSFSKPSQFSAKLLRPNLRNKTKLNQFSVAELNSSKNLYLYNVGLKNILENSFLKIQLNFKNNINIFEDYLVSNSNLLKNKNELIGDININLASLISCPIAEYSLGKELEKSISFPTNIVAPNQSKWKNFIANLNDVSHKPYLFQENGPVLGSLNHSLEANYQTITNKESLLYKTEFVCFKNKNVNLQLPFIKTYTYCSFEGELIYKNSKSFKYSKPDRFTFESLVKQSKQFSKMPLKNLNFNSNLITQEISSSALQLNSQDSNPFLKRSSTNQSFTELFSNKSIDNSCMILTKKDQISFYFPSSLNKINQNYKEIYFSLENLKKKNQYFINDVIIHFLNLSEEIKDNNELPINTQYNDNDFKKADTNSNQDFIDSNLNNEFIFKINKLPTGMSQQKGKLLIGDFLVYGDRIGSNFAVPKSGQIIHLNNKKITLRQGQPIFISPKSILHKYDGDFIEQQSPVITLSYQQLKTGDIIQGIPKVEQFFEARTTKRGRLFHDSLANLLKGLFKRYYSKLPLDQAVRQSFYKIQQIIVDGVQRVYRSQGVTIADKHLEVIVKQMTSKVRIIEGGQTGFFPGEIVDLEFVEQVNSLLMKKISYEPLVLGITKSSLEVDSFLSAASFQQTTRVLSKAAISRKKDFLKGLKENVILGNLIPAGTGYLVYLDQI